MFTFILLLINTLFITGADTSSHLDELEIALQELQHSEKTPGKAKSKIKIIDESKAEAASAAVEEKKPILSVSKTIKPRYGQLIFDGYQCMAMIASAINAETKGLYFSLYEISPYLTDASKEDSLNPIISALYTKRDAIPTKKVLLNKKTLSLNKRMSEAQINYAQKNHAAAVEKQRLLVALLNTCKCRSKESKEEITKNRANFSHTLHQKIYLFENAYQGEPVCFIGSHNPTDDSTKHQHNSMLMLTGLDLYTDLKARFDVLFKHYATRTHKDKLTLEEESTFSNKIVNHNIPQINDPSLTMELSPSTKIKLLKTPLAEDDGDEIVDAIVNLIDKEKDELFFIHRNLTDKKIVDALCRAVDREVAVHIIINHDGLRSDVTKNSPTSLAFKKLHKAMDDVPKCSFGIMKKKDFFLLHDKTLACRNKGDGIVVIGSWNATGNSTRNCCEASVVCKKNSALYEKIKSEFDQLKIKKTSTGEFFYETSKELMREKIFKAAINGSAPDTSAYNSINNWS